MEHLDSILLIDDDAELAAMLREYLRRQNLTLHAASNGDKGLQLLQKHTYAVVLLDVMLPGRDGFEVLKELRAMSRIDVIMLTARGDDVDRILGLEMGADDYLPKPFNPRELLARIRAVQRRKEKRMSETRFQANGITLDSAQRLVNCNGKPVPLTTVEFELLKILLESAGQVVSRDALVRSVLGRDLHPFDRSLDMHISRLRKKLEAAGSEDCIKTLRSVGYQLAVFPGNEIAETRSR